LGGGTRETGLAIEYVRTRRVVRLLGWLSEAPIDPVEIPIDQLCEGLGITFRDLGAPQHFMLFAGSHHRPSGGLRDLVGTFDAEDDAWDAFRELRQAHPATQGWAELAVVDGSAHVTQLAWFGLHPADAGDEAPVRARPMRRRIRTGDSASYLRAVTPS
jgi:hypothetical protein